MDVPASALAAGFSNEPAGTHSSRAIMLAELETLLRATPVDATYEDYAAAVVSENVLGRSTLATRAKSLRHLRELYALRSDVPVFASLRRMWSSDVEAHPLVALLCAIARDPLLRATAELILEAGVGSAVSATELSEAVGRAFPRRSTRDVLARIGRNVASSWTQSGHLRGRSKKTRAHPRSTPAAAAYALYLGHLCDATGSGLFRTLPARLLDVPETDARELARAASRLGWITYRAAAGMTEVTFRQLEASAERRSHESSLASSRSAVPSALFDPGACVSASRHAAGGVSSGGCPHVPGRHGH
ncbi:MAG: hypothetical protein FJ028_00300 [Chloroflexi bacterium]|nr:hypothetical protein [Chloroflexota bacterium]